MKQRLGLTILVAAILVTPATAGEQGKPRGPKATPKVTSTAKAPKASAAANRGNANRGGANRGARATTNARANKPVNGNARSNGRGNRAPSTSASPALPRNPKLVERLRLLLPPGTDMDLAASGFRNQGQFVAAVHVANNHDIAFVDLKRAMVDGGLSLGQAIQKLRPALDADDAARRATIQADADLGSSTNARRKPR